jgi:hypothetical protein
MEDLRREIRILDDMLASLVEILEEKGVLTQEEWEERIRRKIEEAKNLIKFEDMGGEK